MKKFSSITRANSRHTSRNKKLKTLLVLFIVLVALIFIAPKLFAGVASLVLTPVHGIQNWFANSSGSFPYYLRDRGELVNEISLLKGENAAQSGERFTIELLSSENAELRSLLGDKEENKIVAGIIGRPNKLPYDVLVLDKGHEDGIVEGAPVFIGKNSVIGVVEKVFGKSSVVQLITSSGFNASVYIIGPNIYTNAVGIGGGQLRVGVPQGITLSVGDLVILPSASAGVYGAISVVDSIPTRPEQYGYVSPEIPIASLRLVSVGDAPLEPISFEEAQAVVNEAQTTVFAIPVPENILVTANGSTTATSSTSTAATSTTTP